MVFGADVVKVLVASPSDTTDERDAVARGLAAWNAARAEREQVVVLPWLYERHAVPLLGASGQSIINAQAVDESDIVIACFDSRLGQATEAAVSGTAEEIERANGAGKFVHVYFSNEPVDRSAIDVEQLAALEEFRKRLETLGLLGEYASPDDLAYQVRAAIDYDVSKSPWGSGASGATKKSGADLSWRHVHEREQTGLDNRGKVKYRTTRNDLVVVNAGDVKAEGVKISLVPIGDMEFHFEGPSDPFDLGPRSELGWLLIPLYSGNIEITATWSENGHAHSSTQTVLASSH